MEPQITKKVKKSHPGLKPLIKEESTEKPQIKEETINGTKKIEGNKAESIVVDSENTVCIALLI